MYKDLEFIGSFFLPNKLNNKITGKVSFDENSLATLEIHGSFPDVDRNIDVILFTTTSNEEFTFAKCFCYGHNIGDSVWEAKYSIFGQLFTSFDDLKFHSIIISCEYLNEWIGITGFNRKKQKSIRKHTIEYIQPKSVKFKIDKNIKGSFIFNTMFHTYPIHKTGITESIKIKLESTKTVATLQDIVDKKASLEEGVSLTELFEYAFKMVNFLTVVYHQPCVITNIEVESRKYFTLAPAGYFPSTLDVSFEYNKPVHHRKLFRPLITYQDLKPKINKIIPRWFTKLHTLEPVFNILIESYTKANGTVENNFLNISQAIETLHRRTRKNTKLQPKQHKKMLASVKNKLNIKQNEFFQDIFAFSNEPSLKNRIDSLFGEFDLEFIKKLIPNKDKFSQDFRNCRNYYTHYSHTLEKKRLSGVSLYYLTERAKVLLIVYILFEIGFSKQEINKYFKRGESKIFHLYDKEKVS
jgi:hypothetical protein